METTTTVHIQSISQLHQLLELPKPKHPLVSLMRFEDFPEIKIEQRTRLITLGFEYPQSFSKLFKTKTQQTPMQFRADFI